MTNKKQEKLRKKEVKKMKKTFAKFLVVLAVCMCILTMPLIGMGIEEQQYVLRGEQLTLDRVLWQMWEGIAFLVAVYVGCSFGLVAAATELWQKPVKRFTDPEFESLMGE
ncbi:MAG: hypothetical protein ABIO02_01295 [Patescibacteria group bacterium]